MNNNFRVVFYLRGKGYTTKDGKTPIQVRIYLGSQRKPLSNTGYSIEEKYWDAKNQRVSGKSGEARFINSQLQHIETDLWGIFRNLEFSEELSLDRIKAEYLKEDQPTETVLTYYDNFIEMRLQEVGHGLTPASIQKYKVVRRHFGEYLKKKHHRADLKFAELNYSIISGFEHFMRTEEGCQNNTVMRMLRTFKTVIINATKEGLLAKDPYLGVRIHFDPVDRGFLNDAEIKKLMQAEFSVKRLEHVRDMFVFSCFTGLAYIDIANLLETDIMEINGKPWIVRRRHKTKVDSHVPLLDIPLILINKYKGTTKDDHVFPVMSNQKTNAYLKEIADLCGIEKKLTCHLARHTFATMALTKGVPIESVSSMLGHTNIKTTQVYARITSKKVEDDMTNLAEKLTSFNDCNKMNVDTSVQANNVIVENEQMPSPVVKKRGRPKKEVTVSLASEPTEPTLKKRGRPRKEAAAETATVVEAPKTTAEPTAPAIETLTPQIIDGKMVIKTPDGRTFVIGSEIAAAQTAEPEVAAPAKKRGRPRKVQTEETPKASPSSTAYVDGKFVTTQEPPLEETKKRQRIPRGVKVETPIVRQTRRR